jgi:ABC-type Fe3+-hydroxamate transport system substrate-binding protein
MALSALWRTLLGVASALVLGGCHPKHAPLDETITVTDQLGRSVTVPRHMTRISALHHWGGKIVYAPRQQDKLVEQSLYGKEAQVLARIDPKFAAMPKTADGPTAKVMEDRILHQVLGENIQIDRTIKGFQVAPPRTPVTQR